MKKILFAVVMLTIVLTIASCGASNDVTKEEVNDTAKEGVNDTAKEEEKEEVNDAVNEEVNDSTNEEKEDATIGGGSNETESTVVSLESIIEETYLTTGLEFPRLVTAPLTKENQSYMLGVDDFDFIDGVVSEPMMTSQAHSVVLFTVAEGSDIEVIKADIKANVDGRKWICVGVEPEDIIVDNIGNMIILIMDEQSQAIYEAFLATVN